MYTDKDSFIKASLQNPIIGVNQCYRWFQKNRMLKISRGFTQIKRRFLIGLRIRNEQIFYKNSSCPSRSSWFTPQSLSFRVFSWLSWLTRQNPSIRENLRPSAAKIKSLALLVAVQFAAFLPLHANISEPDTIFYGQVFHNTDQPILAGDKEVNVKAIVDGEILAEYTLKAGNHNYALRIPMDNGGLPSLDGTAQPGDNVYIVIENIQQTQTYEVSGTQPSGYTIPAGRGSIILLDLHIISDVGSITDSSANYEDWLAQHFSSSDLNDPAKESTHWGEQADIDEDGRSNLTEYALGLNPRDPNDVNEGVEMEVRGNARGQRHLYVTFNQRINDPSLIYLPQVSDDKETWSSNFTKLREYNRTDLESGSFQRVTYQDLTQGVPGQPRHFQLTIERH